MLVRFLKGWRMFQPGEIAGFEPDMAQPLIAGGFAALVDPEAEAGEAEAGEAEAVTESADPMSASAARRKGKSAGLPVQGADTVTGGGEDTIAGAGDVTGADTGAGA